MSVSLFPSDAKRGLQLLVEPEAVGIVGKLFGKVDEGQLSRYLESYIPSIYSKAIEYLDRLKRDDRSFEGIVELRSAIIEFDETVGPIFSIQNEKIRKLFKDSCYCEYLVMAKKAMSLQPLFELEAFGAQRVPYLILWQVASGNNHLAERSLEVRIQNWFEFVFKKSCCMNHPFRPSLFKVHELIKGVVKTMGLYDDRLGLVRIENVMRKVLKGAMTDVVDNEWYALWIRALNEERVQGAFEDIVVKRCVFTNGEIAFFATDHRGLIMGRDRFTLGQLDLVSKREYGLPAPCVIAHNFDGRFIMVEHSSWNLKELLDSNISSLNEIQKYALTIQLRRLVDYFYFYGLPKKLDTNEILVDSKGAFLTIMPLEKGGFAKNRTELKAFVESTITTNQDLLKVLL